MNGLAFKHERHLSDKADKGGRMERIDEQRVQVLLHHWQHHNEQHANSYKEWADRLREGGWGDVAELLQEAARLTLEINEVFNKAKGCL